MKKDKGRWLYSHSFLYLNIIIPMEKLIELLKKYDKEKWLHTNWKITQNNKIQIYGKWICSESYLISKKYWFIKWLVENEKIDLVKFSDKLSNSYWTMEDRYRYLNSDFWLCNTLLMLLSISDTPIKDLISYLK